MKKFTVKIEVTQTLEFTTQTDEFENEDNFQGYMLSKGLDWNVVDKLAETHTDIEVIPVRDDAIVDRENWEWILSQ